MSTLAKECQTADEPVSFFRQLRALLGKIAAAQWAAKGALLLKCLFLVASLACIYLLGRLTASTRAKSEDSQSVSGLYMNEFEMGDQFIVHIGNFTREYGNELALRTNGTSVFHSFNADYQFILGDNTPQGFEDRLHDYALSRLVAASPNFAALDSEQRRNIVQTNFLVHRISSDQTFADKAVELRKATGSNGTLAVMTTVNMRGDEFQFGTVAWDIPYWSRTMTLNNPTCPTSHCVMNLDSQLRHYLVPEMLAYAAMSLSRLPDAENTMLWNTTLQGMPLPIILTAENMGSFSLIFILLLIAAILPIYSMSSAVVAERESKLREYLFINGVRSSAYTASFIVDPSLQHAVISIVTTIILYTTGAFKTASPFVVCLLLFIGQLSLVGAGFVVANIVRETKHSANIMLVVTMSIMVTCLSAEPDPTIVGTTVKGVALSLLVPMYGLVAQLNRVWLREVTPHGAIRFTPLDATCYTYLVCSIVCVAIYFLIAAYLDQVMPHVTGTRKHPLFFLPGFSSKSAKENNANTADAKDASAFYSPNTDPTREPVFDASKRTVAIRLANLSKHYSSLSLSKKGARVVTKAVDGVHLDMYAGEIFGLLGHNGAGKTTTFSMLCGMTEVTSGTAYVYGSDIRSDMPRIRQALGYVPQHDILIPNFTVDQHVRLIAQIKGIDTKSRAFTMTYDDYLAQLDMTAHRRKLASNLSGGQKRKMMLMMALVADPRVLLLDEVTSGMDSASRRRVWDLISSTKQSRFTLLSTHSMDEADVLADRKAIMNKGSIVCVGTSSFLKSLYRIGHRLEVSADSLTNVNRIDNLVRSLIKGASQSVVTEQVSSYDARWILPDESVWQFPRLFDAIDAFILQNQLTEVVSLSVSVSSLEDVFLSVTLPNDTEGASKDVIKVVNATSNLKPSWVRNLTALLWLRMLLRIRHWSTLLFGFVIPLIALVIFTSPALHDKFDDKLKSISLSSSLYPGNFVIFHPDNAETPSAPKCVLDHLAEHHRATVVKESISTSWFKSRPIKEDYQGAFGFTDGAFTVYVNPRKTITSSVTIAMLKDAFLACAEIPSPTKTTIITDVVAKWEGSPLAEIFSKGRMGVSTRFLFLFRFGFFVIFFPLCALVGMYVREREKRLLHTLYVMGVHRSLYWLANIILDYTLMVISCAVLIAIFMSIPFFDLFDGVEQVIVTLLVGSMACLVYTYVIGHLFKREEQASKMVPLVALVLPVFLHLGIYIASIVQYETLPDEEQEKYGSAKGMPLYKVACSVIGLTSPIFTFDAFFGEMAELYNYLPATVNSPFVLKNALTKIQVIQFYDEALNLPQLSLVFLGQAIVFFGILLFADWCRTGVRANVRPVDASEQARRASERTHIDPPNVTNERTRLLPNNNARDTIKVRNVSKTFNKTRVVDDVTFGVSKGECFGLLGPNGAGKSTTMNMITAEFAPDEGSISFEDRSVFEDIVAARKKIGYCPQKNVLWDDLTLEEHLRLFASLKGVPASAIDAWIDAFLDALDIRHYRSYATKKLSGGNQRKVCFGIAFIGKPAVAVLDEASTGLDVASRLHMLKIMRAFRNDSAMVLVTHNMVEAERLCSRVAILVNGRVSVLGSAQQLKHQLGFCVELHGRDMVALSGARSRLVEALPGATVSEEFGLRVKFHVPLADVRSVGLGNMFRMLEEFKGDPSMRLSEYLVTQETMERVFLDAVAGQTGCPTALGDKEKKKKKWLCV